MSSSNCCFLTCIQVSQEAGQVAWYAHLFQNSPQFIVIHTFEGFGLVNKAEIDVFLELSFSMIQWMLAIWSLVPLPFLKPAWTSSLKSVRNCYAIFLRWNAASSSCSLTHSVPFVHFQFLRNTHKSLFLSTFNVNVESFWSYLVLWILSACMSNHTSHISTF